MCGTRFSHGEFWATQIRQTAAEEPGVRRAAGDRRARGAGGRAQPAAANIGRGQRHGESSATRSHTDQSTQLKSGRTLSAAAARCHFSLFSLLSAAFLTLRSRSLHFEKSVRVYIACYGETHAQTWNHVGPRWRCLERILSYHWGLSRLFTVAFPHKPIPKSSAILT